MVKNSVAIFLLLSFWTAPAFAAPVTNLTDDFGNEIEGEVNAPANGEGHAEPVKPITKKNTAVKISKQKMPLPATVKPLAKKKTEKKAEKKKAVKFILMKAPVRTVDSAKKNSRVKAILPPVPAEEEFFDDEEDDGKKETVTTILPPPVPRVSEKGDKGKRVVVVVPPAPKDDSEISSGKGDKGKRVVVVVPPAPKNDSETNSGKGDKGKRVVVVVPPAPKDDSETNSGKGDKGKRVVVVVPPAPRDDFDSGKGDKGKRPRAVIPPSSGSSRKPVPVIVPNDKDTGKGDKGQRVVGIVPPSPGDDFDTDYNKGDKGKRPQAVIPAKPGASAVVSRPAPVEEVEPWSPEIGADNKVSAQAPAVSEHAPILPPISETARDAVAPEAFTASPEIEEIVPAPVGTAPKLKVISRIEGEGAMYPAEEPTVPPAEVEEIIPSGVGSAQNLENIPRIEGEGAMYPSADEFPPETAPSPVVPAPVAPARIVEPAAAGMSVVPKDQTRYGESFHAKDAAKFEPIIENDDAPVQEHLPVDIDTYLEMKRIPKYVRINTTGYRVRTTPDFEKDNKDNIAFQSNEGAFYPVLNQYETEEGVATKILADGEVRWIFMPWSQRNNIQYCESEACFADVKIGLDAIANGTQVDLNSLKNCGITGVDHQGQAVLKNLPRTIKEAVALEDEDEEEEIPVRAPRGRPRAEAEILERRLPPVPKVAPIPRRESGCVEDTRSRPKPNFRNFKSIEQTKRAFIDYMTPYALEVQEATGLPASVIIAQAALESHWGKSDLFMTTKNALGHSCWSPSTTQAFRLTIRGQEKLVIGTCDRPRERDAGGGYFLAFKDSQDSVYAYAANILNPNRNYYPLVKSAIREARPAPANWSDVVNGLQKYCPEPDYRAKVRNMVVSNGLQKMENMKLCR